MKASYARIDGRLTRYFSAGEGPLLMLVHPVGYPAEVYARNIDALAATRTVVAFDLPGQGFSEAPRPWDAAPQVVMARHAVALADHLDAVTFSILGSSLGGLVAALVALQFPSRVDRLILIGTGSVFNEPAGQPAILQKVYANGSRAYADPSLHSCRARLANTCFEAPPADDILLAHLSAYAWPSAADDYREIIERLSASIADPASSVFPHLEKINAPSLIIVGNRDVRTSYEAHRAGAARLRDAQLLRLDACGHLPFLERPDRFNDCVARFLAGETVGERVRP